MKKALMIIASLCLLAGVVLVGLGVQAFVEAPKEPQLSPEDRQAIRASGEAFIKDHFSPIADLVTSAEDNTAPDAAALRDLVAYRLDKYEPAGALSFVDGKARALDDQSAQAQFLFDWTVGPEKKGTCSYQLLMVRHGDGWQVAKALAHDGLPSPGQADEGLADYPWSNYDRDVAALIEEEAP
ncbi:hypothetical protein ACKQTC_06560 [Peptococcus simiae]|uniref:DUF4829 domain-containing protein n=1 Tax=Peptococcus simiae TaxID=1643805 RepID=A0ABW9GZI0_9FIRM